MKVEVVPFAGRRGHGEYEQGICRQHSHFTILVLTTHEHGQSSIISWLQVFLLYHFNFSLQGLSLPWLHLF